MIITRLFIDNLYGFQDFELDLTYPRKNSKFLIEFEYLEEVPQFKFKRVCILMGTNASGKTSLGRVLWNIQTMLNTKTYTINESLASKTIALKISEQLLEAISNKESMAKVELEFLEPPFKVLQHLYIEFDKNGLIVSAKHTEIELKSNDTNLSVKKRLDIQKQKSIQLANHTSIVEITRRLLSFKESVSFKESGYYYVFAENHNTADDFPISLTLKNNLHKIFLVLKTFDPTITDVRPLLTEMENGESIAEGYTVFFENRDSVKVTDNGETFTAKGKNRFSKGTYDVLSITDFLSYILEPKLDEWSITYFLDEKLASSHSELEISILNLIIQKLNKYSQFFYTTHNYDVLDLNLPAHSFAFLHKEFGYCSVEQPEKLGFSKNDRNLKGYVRNNYFRTVPSTNHLDNLMWESDDE